VKYETLGADNDMICFALRVHIAYSIVMTVRQLNVVKLFWSREKCSILKNCLLFFIRDEASNNIYVNWYFKRLI